MRNWNIKAFLWISARTTNRTVELHEAHFQTEPLSQCNASYLAFDKDRNSIKFREGIRRSQYCAYYDPNYNYTEDNCRVLSGGSLQYFPSHSLLPTVVGIISFGMKLNGQSICYKQFPLIFTRVAYFVPWIESHVWPFDRSEYNLENYFNFMAFWSTV